MGVLIPYEDKWWANVGWLERTYLDIFLVGGIPTPLKNDGLRQLG